MKFGDIFKTSLFKFSSYPSLLLVSNFKTVLYVFFLAFIMLFGLSAAAVPLFSSGGGFAGIAEKNLPEFSIKNGELTCKKVLIDDSQNSMYILVDDTKQGQIDLPDGYLQALTISRTDLLIRNNYQTNSLKLSEIGSLTKADVVAWLKDNTAIICFVLAVFMLAGFLISLSFNMLVTALIAKAFNVLFIHASLRFGEIFKMTVFSMTLSVILNMIFAALGLGVFSMIAPFITMFYLAKGMKACRDSEGIVIEVLE